MITRATLSTIEQGLPKYRSMLAGNTAYSPGSFESIATTTVGAGGSASIAFTSIPSTYTHLQIRANVLFASSGNNYFRINDDAATNYTWHQLQGTGTTVDPYTSTPSSTPPWGLNAGSSTYPMISILDILDYTNTNKKKTTMVLSGNDTNGTVSNSRVGIYSSLWQSTNTITKIEFFGASNFLQYSQMALYGIKVS